ncbi:MAG: Holliday junction resolvase RuvX [Helicobacteraceae bacterium]|nr:Holliday junction resolvase RuvX [Helicobacteraceae bacterium]
MPTLAIDLGLKRIGLAYSPDDKIALPLGAVIRVNRDQAAKAALGVAKAYNIDRIVFGVPIGGSSEEAMRRRAAHFAALIGLDAPVFYEDETNSSQEAATLAAGRLGKTKDGRLDSLAALIILERFLERKCADLSGLKLV